MQNIFIQYLSWQFLEMPRDILAGWRNFLKFGLNYFSVSLLVRTFFSPWHKYTWAYPKGFDIGKYLEVFFSNLITRILGVILKSFLIFFGILAEIFIFLLGLILFFGWLILPILLISGFIFGIKYVLF